MKLIHSIYVLGAVLCLAACSKDECEPYEPTEWQYDRYMDADILPGDDFYRFVCGKGIAVEGADSWTPLHCWRMQENDYSTRSPKTWQTSEDWKSHIAQQPENWRENSEATSCWR